MARITTVSEKCIRLIEQFEGLYTDAYKCPAGVPTIGLGSTYYEDGTRVKLGDKITKERAYQLLRNTLKQYEREVDSFTRDDISQAQFDALVDFAYNCGSANLKSSSLLRKANANPNDPTIRNSFMAWVFAGDGTKNGIDDDGDGLVDEPKEKKKLNGLIRRRQAEADLYFGV